MLDQLKIGADGGWVFTALFDLGWMERSQVGCPIQILNFGGVDAHDSAAGGIDGDEVLAENQDAGLLGSSLDGSVPFHADDAIDDGESPPELAVDGDDGVGDSDVVKGVFRPAVNGTGHEAEEIFHRKGGTGPVMGLHFWHGDDEIGGEGGIREKELTEAGEVFDGADVVAIEIDKIVFEIFDVLPIAGFVGEAEGIAAVAWAFGDGYRGGSEGAEGGEGRGDQGDVGIDGGCGIELNEVGFEDDAFIFDLEAAEADAVEDVGDEVFLVAFGFEDGDG